MNKKVLITGATGMVGAFVLKNLLDAEDVMEVISLVRKQSNVTHPKLTEIVHCDFTNYSTLTNEFNNVDVCFYCLGVYTNAVSTEMFERITCDFQKALTNTLEINSPQSKFVLFSATGADTSEKSRAVFARCKGRAENLLNKCTFPKKYIFRPGFIKPTGERRPVTWDYRLMQPIYNLLGKLFPKYAIKDCELAQAMVDIGLKGDLTSSTFENPAIKKLLND